MTTQINMYSHILSDATPCKINKVGVPWGTFPETSWVSVTRNDSQIQEYHVNIVNLWKKLFCRKTKKGNDGLSDIMHDIYTTVNFLIYFL